MNHPGPTQFYLAKVPSGQSAKTWDGSGAVWFKFSTTMPTVDKNKQMTWPGQSEFMFLFGAAATWFRARHALLNSTSLIHFEHIPT